MITKDEMILKIMELFEIDEFQSGFIRYKNYYIKFKTYVFILYDDNYNTIYESSKYKYDQDDFTEYLDELIIFKELILPKYL